MTQAHADNSQLTQMSTKLDAVLSHVETIPDLQQEIKLFKMDVAVLQLDMAAANATLHQHTDLLGKHSISIGALERDVASLKARFA